MISSAVGAEGLRLDPGQHFTEADTSGEMAAAIIDGIRNPGAATETARQGRAVVEANYDWGMLAKHMEQAWFRVASK